MSELLSEQLHFEFEEYPDMNSGQVTSTNIPSFDTMLAKKIPSPTSSEFDPHMLMVKKRLIDSGENVSNIPKQSWPEKDIKALEDFCLKYGIIGFNCGKMSPIAALAMLKQKLGVIEPTENRVTYSDAMNQKILLKG